MSKSHGSTTSGPSESSPSTNQKAGRIVDDVKESANHAAEQARHAASTATESISAFVNARPLTCIAAVFCLGVLLGRRHSH